MCPSTPMHQVEPTSTAAYGLAHIFAALSVTNKELKTKALADRGVTPDQYEQMQKLQKITPRRAAAGAGAAEAVDEDEAAAEAAAAEQLNQDVDEGSDPDTEALCLARVRRVAALGGVAVLARLLAQVMAEPYLLRIPDLASHLIPHFISLSRARRKPGKRRPVPCVRCAWTRRCAGSQCSKAR